MIISSSIILHVASCSSLRGAFDMMASARRIMPGCNLAETPSFSHVYICSLVTPSLLQQTPGAEALYNLQES